MVITIHMEDGKYSFIDSIIHPETMGGSPPTCMAAVKIIFGEERIEGVSR